MTQIQKLIKEANALIKNISSATPKDVEILEKIFMDKINHVSTIQIKNALAKFGMGLSNKLYLPNARFDLLDLEVEVNLKILQLEKGYLDLKKVIESDIFKNLFKFCVERKKLKEKLYHLSLFRSELELLEAKRLVSQIKLQVLKNPKILIGKKIILQGKKRTITDCNKKNIEYKSAFSKTQIAVNDKLFLNIALDKTMQKFFSRKRKILDAIKSW